MRTVRFPSSKTQGSPNNRNPVPGSGSNNAAQLPFRTPTAFAYSGNATTENPAATTRSNIATCCAVSSFMNSQFQSRISVLEYISQLRLCHAGSTRCHSRWEPRGRLACAGRAGLSTISRCLGAPVPFAARSILTSRSSSCPSRLVSAQAIGQDGILSGFSDISGECAAPDPTPNARPPGDCAHPSWHSSPLCARRRPVARRGSRCQIALSPIALD